MDNTTDRTRLVADTTGSEFTPVSYDIAPEDLPLAERLAQFDPLATPSPVKLTGGGAFNAPERFTLSILPPEKQGPIASKLAQVPTDQRAQIEHELVMEALKQNSIELRVKAGPGAGATPVDRERLLIAREVFDLESEEAAIFAQLAEVERWIPVFDQETGAPVIDPRTGQQQVKAVERKCAKKYALPRTYVSGESHFYLGRRFKLIVVPADRGSSSVRLWRGRIEVALPVTDPAAVRRRLTAWYREKALAHFSKKLTGLVDAIDELDEVPEFQLLAMEKQWGSCSPAGRLSLNPALIKAPVHCIDYVLLHELCHLIEHNHSKQFYALLGRYCPNWKAWKQETDSSASGTNHSSRSTDKPIGPRSLASSVKLTQPISGIPRPRSQSPNARSSSSGSISVRSQVA